MPSLSPSSYFEGQSKRKWSETNQLINRIVSLFIDHLLFMQLLIAENQARIRAHDLQQVSGEVLFCFLGWVSSSEKHICVVSTTVTKKTSKSEPYQNMINGHCNSAHMFFCCWSVIISLFLQATKLRKWPSGTSTKTIWSERGSGSFRELTLTSPRRRRPLSKVSTKSGPQSMPASTDPNSASTSNVRNWASTSTATSSCVRVTVFQRRTPTRRSRRLPQRRSAEMDKDRRRPDWPRQPTLSGEECRRQVRQTLKRSVTFLTWVWFDSRINPGGDFLHHFVEQP